MICGLLPVRGPNEADLRLFRLGDFRGSLERFRAGMSAFEREREARYGTDDLRDAFAIRRGMLRAILASVLNCEPASVELKEADGQKPRLAGGGISFSVSHSRDVVLIGLSRREIGVDIEALDRGFPIEGVARDHFTARERAALASAEDPMATFFTLWTRKEACAKALGLGVTASFALYEDPAPPDPTGAARTIAGGLELHDLAVGDAFLASLAFAPARAGAM